jgi:hypothetical protein
MKSCRSAWISASGVSKDWGDRDGTDITDRSLAGLITINGTSFPPRSVPPDRRPPRALDRQKYSVGASAQNPATFNAHSPGDTGSDLVQYVFRLPARIPTTEPSRKDPCAAPPIEKRSSLSRVDVRDDSLVFGRASVGLDLGKRTERPTASDRTPTRGKAGRTDLHHTKMRHQLAGALIFDVPPRSTSLAVSPAAAMILCLCADKMALHGLNTTGCIGC